jgi:hypothetical protein
MSEAISTELEIIEKDALDLSLLHSSAETFRIVTSMGVDVDTTRVLLAEAQANARREFGQRLLLITGIYALSEDGPIYGLSVFGTVKSIVPTSFLDEPMDRHNASTLDGGLGVLVEPLDDGINPDSPFAELHGYASIDPVITVPLNHNLVFAGCAPFEAPML